MQKETGLARSHGHQCSERKGRLRRLSIKLKDLKKKLYMIFTAVGTLYFKSIKTYYEWKNKFIICNYIFLFITLFTPKCFNCFALTIFWLGNRNWVMFWKFWKELGTCLNVVIVSETCHVYYCWRITQFKLHSFSIFTILYYNIRRYPPRDIHWVLERCSACT